MQVIATHRYARISAFKAREVTREIQGLPAVDALQQLGFIPKKAAPLIAKTLKSAIANAEHNNNLRPELLVIKEAVIGEAPTIKRVRPKARGSAGPVRKRNSHIRIVLTDEVPIVRRSDKPKTSGKAKAKKAAAAPVPAASTATAEATPESNA
ncbi:MAG: 50S ribosomal protein L22 [Chthoniobacterales bacterium]